MYKIKDIINQIHCADCLKFLKKIPDDSIDLILTDPPYNVGKVFDKKQEKTYFDIKFHKKWLKECDRIVKLDGQMYIFWWSGFLKEITNILDYKQVLYWTKPFAMMRRGRRGWQNFTELIFWKVYSDDFTFNALKGMDSKDYFTDVSCINLPNERFHITQKPISLVEKLVGAGSNPNDIILDPFSGSGTTLVAAQNLHRQFIGIEISQKYCEIIKNRLKQKPLL